MNSRPERIFDPDFESALKNLQGDQAVISPSLLFALSDLDRQELAKFAKVWLQVPVEKRRRVTIAMSELAEERIEADFNRIFRYLIDDEDPEVRASAINGLWESEDATLITPLIGSLRSDPSARVRAAAAEALGRFVLLGETKRIPASLGDEIQVALLAVIRGSDDMLVRRRAIEALAYIGDETVRDIVVTAYADDDSKMRATAVFAMGRSADPYWKRTVAQELFSPDPQMRFEAARAIGELEFKAAVPRLIELLEDPDREVQGAAIASLGQIGGKDARNALVAVIESDDEVAAELAHDALDELEFSSGSNMLLVDMGLESEEEELLVDEYDAPDSASDFEPDVSEADFEPDDADESPDLLDDKGLRPRRKH